jgi:hypothetical protein
MRRIVLLPTAALMALFLLAGTPVAQPPGPRPGPPREFLTRPALLGVDDVVERIMAFDKNRDGKVTRDELPERMHHLIELGDTNKDGALDRDEIRKLAARLAATPGGFGGLRTLTVDRPEIRIGPGPGPGPGPGARGGFGPDFRIGPGPGIVEGVVDDLKLPGKKKDQAVAAAKAHEENVARLMDQARADLLQKMKEILSDEEFEDFKAALDRPRGATVIFGAPDGPRPGVGPRPPGER